VPELELGLLLDGLLFGGVVDFLEPGDDFADPALLFVGLPGFVRRAPVVPKFFNLPHDDDGETLKAKKVN